MVVTQGIADAQKKIAAYKQRKLAQKTIKTTGQTKQQVLDTYVKSGQAQVDKTGQIFMNGKILGNTSEFSGNDQANTYNQTTQKFEAPKNGTEGTIQPENIGTPEDTAAQTNNATQSLTGPQEKPQETLTSNQNVVGGNVGGMNVSQQQTKQQVLDKAISSGQARVDTAGNIISSSGNNLGNINQLDLTQSAIGQTAPNANAPIQQQTQQNTQQQDQTQQQVNNISPDTSLGLSNSPDSPFWNMFGQAAIDNENQLPGYMNERNKVIASSVMLNNPSMKYMSDAKRKDMILRDIIDRQEGGIDPNTKDWYAKTVDNINNIINRSIPAYTANDYFGMMLDGTSKNIDYSAAAGNPTLKAARTRFNELNKYSSMDTTSLSDAIKTGKLNKGGQLWNDLLNKGMGESLNKAYSMYNMQQEAVIYDYVTNEVSSFDSGLSLESQGSMNIDLGTGLDAQISEKILSLMTNPDDAPTLGSFLAADEDVANAKKASRATEAEINNLSDQIKEFSDDIKTKVVERGGEATDDPFLESYIQEKTKPFNKRLSTLNSKYRNEIALLEDATTTATTAFEVQQYNKNMQIQGYQFVLGRLDAQEAKKTAADAAALAQSNWEKSFNQSVSQNKQQQSNREKSFALQQQQSNQTQENRNKTFNAENPVTPGTKTGTMTDITFGGKTFSTDSGIAPVLSKIEQELNAAGINRDTGASNGPRSKEEQAALVKAGKSWTMNSNHNNGLAVDMYTNNGKSSALQKPTPEMIKIMNANGFYQDPKLMGKGDYGHFDYKGKPTGSSGDTSSLSTNAATIVAGYADLNDSSITGGERLKLASEIGSYFDANKDKFTDPNEFYIRKSSIYNGKPGAVTTNKLESIANVGFQLDNLEATFNKMDTGPLRQLWEKGTDKRTNQDYVKVRQQMEAILPDLARGVFGEKGVLTDTDIERYRKTIPNVGNKENVNKQIVQNLRDILSNTFKSTLVTEAKNGNNMNNWIDDYMRIAGNNYTNTSPVTNNGPVNNTTSQTLLSSPYSRRKK